MIYFGEISSVIIVNKIQLYSSFNAESTPEGGCGYTDAVCVFFYVFLFEINTSHDEVHGLSKVNIHQESSGKHNLSLYLFNNRRSETCSTREKKMTLHTHTLQENRTNPGSRDATPSNPTLPPSPAAPLEYCHSVCAVQSAHFRSGTIKCFFF